MLISLQEILNKYDKHPKGVIHVGAHWAEEHEDYIKCGIEKFAYIEPCMDAYIIILKKLGTTIHGISVVEGISYGNTTNIDVVRCACGSENMRMPMFVSHQNQGQSNSILEPELHIYQHPEVIFDDVEVVPVSRLDDIVFQNKGHDMLVMDVQGYEGEVLLGAVETLKHIDIIYTEVNRGQTYKDNKEIEWLDEFLMSHGFERKETYWPSPNWTWGDAVYLRIKND